MLDVGYILSGFRAGSGDLEFMIVRTIGPLLLPSSTRRPAMNSPTPQGGQGARRQAGTPANLPASSTHAKGNAAKTAKAAKRAADLLPLILPMKAEARRSARSLTG